MSSSRWYRHTYGRTRCSTNSRVKSMTYLGTMPTVSQDYRPVSILANSTSSTLGLRILTDPMPLTGSGRYEGRVICGIRPWLIAIRFRRTMTWPHIMSQMVRVDSTDQFSMNKIVQRLVFCVAHPRMILLTVCAQNVGDGFNNTIRFVQTSLSRYLSGKWIRFAIMSNSSHFLL